VGELRYNTAVQTRVHEILSQVRRGQLDAGAARDRLSRLEAETPRHPRWLVALALGVAAASLAGLLGADVAAAAAAGLSAGLGLLARQALGRRHFSLLALPLTAALLGALLGGWVIRLGWTRTPGLALVVPALMVVPGPHLINGLLDLVDNYLPMSLARFGLAAGILLASAAGIVLGVELTLPDPIATDQVAGPARLHFVSDVLLAGVVTWGFALYYNTAWPQLSMTVLGGMAGHGTRYLALEAGCRLEAATFLGGLVVGAMAAWVARSRSLPVAVIAFAGAVTMVPGLSLYRGLVGAVQLARVGDAADAGTAAATLGNALQGCLVVSALALGVTLGARAAVALAPGRRPEASTM
jgi:uncharacterized membrane protein YjjP (DUF1212 family)